MARAAWSKLQGPAWDGLPADEKRRVIDRIAAGDSAFQALPPQEQDKVRARFVPVAVSAASAIDEQRPAVVVPPPVEVFGSPELAALRRGAPPVFGAVPRGLLPEAGPVAQADRGPLIPELRRPAESDGLKSGLGRELIRAVQRGTAGDLKRLAIAGQVGERETFGRPDTEAFQRFVIEKAAETEAAAPEAVPDIFDVGASIGGPGDSIGKALGDIGKGAALATASAVGENLSPLRLAQWAAKAIPPLAIIPALSEYGEIMQQQAERGTYEPGKAVPAAAVAGALEGLPEIVAGPLGKALGKQAATASRGAVMRGAQTALGAGLGEAVAEPTQTAVERLGAGIPLRDTPIEYAQAAMKALLGAGGPGFIAGVAAGKRGAGAKPGERGGDEGDGSTRAHQASPQQGARAPEAEAAKAGARPVVPFESVDDPTPDKDFPGVLVVQARVPAQALRGASRRAIADVVQRAGGDPMEIGPADGSGSRTLRVLVTQGRESAEQIAREWRELGMQRAEDVAPESPAPVAAPMVERRTMPELREVVAKHGTQAVDEMPEAKLREELAAARQLLRRDELTGMPNRFAFDEAPKQPVVAALDMDSLKWVNDNLGHDVGDSLLRKLAGALEGAVAEHEGASAYRMAKGGDEFALTGASEEAMLKVLDRARSLAGNVEYESPDGTRYTVPVEFTHGIAGEYKEADARAAAEKLQRESRGERSRRGEVPKGLVVEPPAGRDAALSVERGGGGEGGAGGAAADASAGSGEPAGGQPGAAAGTGITRIVTIGRARRAGGHAQAGRAPSQDVHAVEGADRGGAGEVPPGVLPRPSTPETVRDRALGPPALESARDQGAAAEAAPSVSAIVKDKRLRAGMSLPKLLRLIRAARSQERLEELQAFARDARPTDGARKTYAARKKVSEALVQADRRINLGEKNTPARFQTSISAPEQETQLDRFYAASEGREVWQLVLARYLEVNETARTPQEKQGQTPRQRADDAADTHWRSVRSAVDRGESIPAEVLAEYPDLAKRAREREALAEERADKEPERAELEQQQDFEEPFQIRRAGRMLPSAVTTESVRGAFPMWKVVEQRWGWELTRPGYEPVRVVRVGQIKPTEEGLREWGMTLDGYRALQGTSEELFLPGATGVVGARQIVRLALGADRNTIDHEAFHVAMSKALTAREQSAVLKRYGSEEAAAQAYADQKPGESGLLRRVRNWAVRMSGALFGPSWRSVFERVETGRAYESDRPRSLAERLQARRRDRETGWLAGMRPEGEPGDQGALFGIEDAQFTPVANNMAETSRSTGPITHQRGLFEEAERDGVRDEAERRRRNEDARSGQGSLFQARRRAGEVARGAYEDEIEGDERDVTGVRDRAGDDSGDRAARDARAASHQTRMHLLPREIARRATPVDIGSVAPTYIIDGRVWKDLTITRDSDTREWAASQVHQLLLLPRLETDGTSVWTYDRSMRELPVGEVGRSWEDVQGGVESPTRPPQDVTSFQMRRRGENPITADEIPADVLERMNKALRRMDYDVRGADDVRQLLRNRMLKNGKFLTEDWQRAYDQAAGRTQKQTKVGTPHVNWDTVKELPRTDNPANAGYIDPDGQLVDLSGGGSGRNEDHRIVGGTAAMQELVASGWVRFMPESMGFDIGAPPTPAQESAIRRIVEDADGEVLVGLDRGLGEWYDSLGSYRPAEEVRFEYQRGTKAIRVLGDIRRYYAGENIESGQRFQARRRGGPQDRPGKLAEFLRPKTEKMRRRREAEQTAADAASSRDLFEPEVANERRAAELKDEAETQAAEGAGRVQGPAPRRGEWEADEWRSRMRGEQPPRPRQITVRRGAGTAPESGRARPDEAHAPDETAGLRARVGKVVRSVVSGYELLAEGGRQPDRLMRAVGGIGEELYQMVERPWWGGRQLAGELVDDMVLARDALTRSDRRWLDDNFLWAYEDGTPMPNERVQAYADGWRKAATEIGRMAEDLEIPLYDPDGKALRDERGQQRLFKMRNPETYVPHRLTEDAMGALANRTGKLYAAMVEAARSRGIDIKAFEMMASPGYRTKHQGSLEHARLAENLPRTLTVDGKTVKILDTSPRILEQHVLTAARRIKIVEEWGAGGEGERLARIANQLVSAGVTSDNAKEMVRRMWNRLNHQQEWDDPFESHATVRKVWHVVQGVTAAANLSLATIPNLLGGGLPIMVRTGVVPAIKGLAEAWTHSVRSASQAEVRQLAGLNFDLLQDLHQTEGIAGAGQAIARAVGTVTGFNLANRKINQAAAIVARADLRAKIDAIARDDVSMIRKWWGRDALAARRYLEVEYGFGKADVDRMVADGPTREDLSRAMQKAIELTNAVAESPTGRSRIVAHPVARLFFAYSTYVRKFHRTVRYAVTESGHGNVRPLLTLLVAGAVTGEMVAGARAWIKDRKREEEGLERLIADLFEVGTFGMLSRLQYALTHRGRSKGGVAQQASDILTPPHADLLGSLIDGAVGSVDKESLRPLWQSVVRVAPLADAATKQWQRDDKDALADRIGAMVYVGTSRDAKTKALRRPLDPRPGREQTARHLLERWREQGWSRAELLRMIKEKRKEQ